MTIPVCNLQLPENTCTGSWKINPGFNGNRTLDLPELVQFTVTVFQTLWWVVRDTPNDVQLYFFKVNVYGNTRYSKTGIPDQTGGIYTLFQTKMAKSIPCFRLEMLENDTLWGGTYLYGLDIGAPLPPPPSRPPGWCNTQEGGGGGGCSTYHRVMVSKISKKHTTTTVLLQLIVVFHRVGMRYFSLLKSRRKEAH